MGAMEYGVSPPLDRVKLIIYNPHDTASGTVTRVALWRENRSSPVALAAEVYARDLSARKDWMVLCDAAYGTHAAR